MVDKPEPLKAGEHPVPLDQVHADMGLIGPNELRRHLAEEHKIHFHSKFGKDIAQQIHRQAHGEGT